MPTVTLYADNDCFVNDASSTTVFNGTSVQAGWSNVKGAETDRALLHFDVSSIPVGATIISAVYNLYGQSGLDGLQLDVERLTSVFAEGTATWATQPTASTLVTTLTPPGSEVAPSWKSFDITTAVANWLSGAWANDGVRVKAHTESGSPGVQMVWDSDEGTNRPYLTVVYNQPPTQPGVFTAPLAGTNVKETTTIGWGASTDPDGDAVTYRVLLSQDGGATFPTTLVASTASLSASIDWTPYVGASQAVLRVQAYDGTVYGTARDSGVFTIKVGGSHMVI